MDLLIFCGQSNMQGQSDGLSECSIVHNAREYKFCSDELVPLKNPVGEDIKADGSLGFALKGGSNGWEDEIASCFSECQAQMVLGSSCFGFTNLVPSFCREYVANTGRQVVAVHCAKGSSKLFDWMPDGRIYPVLIKKVKGAISKAGENNIDNIYLIWLQGESDAIAGTSKEQYVELLTTLKNSIKKEIKLDRFCIIKVGKFAFDHRDEIIHSAQESACESDKDFYMLTRITERLFDDKKYLNQHYSGHYSALGLEEIGKSAGNALSKLVR